MPAQRAAVGPVHRQKSSEWSDRRHLHYGGVQVDSQAIQSKLPVTFSVEIIHIAKEDVTGATCELGCDLHGDWCPERLGDEDWESHDVESWLNHPEFLGQSFDPLDSGIVQETVERCLLHAQEILQGKRSAACALDVYPVNGDICRIEPGQLLPPGMTHVRRYSEWETIASLYFMPSVGTGLHPPLAMKIQIIPTWRRSAHSPAKTQNFPDNDTQSFVGDFHLPKVFSLPGLRRASLVKARLTTSHQKANPTHFGVNDL